MAKAKVGAAGIEYIQGSLKKPVKKDGHNHGNYLIATHRTAPTQNSECQRLYVRDSDTYKRTGDPNDNELFARERFTAVAAAVKARANNLSNIATDEAAFKAQKDSVGGKKTMRAYLWKVCGDAYDADHPRS